MHYLNSDSLNEIYIIIFNELEDALNLFKLSEFNFKLNNRAA